MADYTPYIPSVGSIDYPTQISTFMILSEAIDTEIETARNGEATLLDHFNLKFDKVGGTITGAITLSSTSPTMWFIESGVSVDNGKWSFVTNAEEFSFRANNDALNIFTDAFKVTRTGTTIDSFEITAISSTINGNDIWHTGNMGSGSGLDADLLDGLTSTSFLRSNVSTTFAGVELTLDNSAKLRLDNTTDASLSSTNHAFQIGASNSTNLIMDGGEIMARSNGSAGVLALNLDGGVVSINGFIPWTSGNDGTSSGLDADLLDGQEGAYYAPINSPAFTGAPSLPTGTTAITQTAGNDSTALATTAYAGNEINIAVPIGTIIMRPVIAIPTGFLECDGSEINRTTYSSLFSILGTIYGIGNGSTTFNIPDYRGEFLRGFDNTAGNDPDAASRTDRGDGTAGDNIGTKQADDYKSHTHLQRAGNTGGSSTYMYRRSDIVSLSDSNATASSGGNETRSRNVNIMYCIKY